jgi:polyhydroxyalkanoate synthesis regulator phasin
MPSESLERLIERLEHAAATLRAGELAPDEAAAVVEDCARLAAEAGTELDRQVRAEIPTGQPALGS